MSEDFTITGDQIFFNGELVGHLTVYSGTIREQVVQALEAHISAEDRADGMDDGPGDDEIPL